MAELITIKVKDWNIKREIGYEPISTFYMDFGLAELDGVKGVLKTYRTIMHKWKHQYKYLTELVLVLNWKIWEHYQTNEELARTYDALWKEADSYAIRHLKGEELSYFYKTTN